jgi:hypothetical protein
MPKYDWYGWKFLLWGFVAVIIFPFGLVFYYFPYKIAMGISTFGKSFYDGVIRKPSNDP